MPRPYAFALLLLFEGAQTQKLAEIGDWGGAINITHALHLEEKVKGSGLCSKEEQGHQMGYRVQKGDHWLLTSGF